MAKTPKSSEAQKPAEPTPPIAVQDAPAPVVDPAEGERQAAGDDEDAETARLAAVQQEAAAASGAPTGVEFAEAGIAALAARVEEGVLRVAADGQTSFTGGFADADEFLRPGGRGVFIPDDGADAPILSGWPTPDQLKAALADMHGIAVEDVFACNAGTGTVVTIDGRKLTWPPA